MRRSGSLVLAVLATAVMLVPNLASGQVAGLGGSVTPAFQTPVTVGDQNQPGIIQLVNGAFGPQAATETLTITNIQVNPACQNSTNQPSPVGPSPCPAGTSEPRPNPALPILDLDETSGPGTTCPGGPFVISGPDAEGDYNFIPTTGPVTLAPVGQPGSSCIIDFTFDVIQRPNDGATEVFATALFTSPSLGSAVQTGRTRVVVNQAAADIETLVSAPAPPGGGTPTVPLGSTFTDTATVTGTSNGPTPTGTVGFTVFRDPPGADLCTGPATDLGEAPLSGPAPTPPTPPTATATSAPVTADTPGTYRFVATYSGDVNYAPLGPTPCGAPGENVTVTQLQLTLETQASTNATDVPSGATVTDTATLTPPAGGPTPTGTVTYTLVGPNPDPGCTGPVVGTSTVPAGSPSEPFTVTMPGTYNFVATYSGDVNYEAITTPVGCGDPAEQFAVARQPVQLATQASTNSTSVAPGTEVTDVATVTAPAGFPAPTGTVTYTLVGPNPNADCTAPVVGSPSTVPVGSPSPPYTVTTPGTYNFVATYSGDANYLPITTPVGCGDPAEMFTVATLPIGLTTQASTNSPNVAPGTAVTDLATFTPPPGGPAPTGTVTYTLVGPNPNADCTAPVVGSPSTAPVGSPSAPYVVTAPGTYNFVATYSGDANYSPITTPVGCGDPNEIFAVALQEINFTTQASTNSTDVAPGTAVTDLATFTPPPGGPAPTGTVTYTLVGPNPDANCVGPVVGSSTVAVGSPSAPFTVTEPGTYNFVATYSGDGFYAPITTPVGCNVPAERFAVAQQQVQLVTQASTNSTTVPPGSTVSDVATVVVPAGRPPATGTVTYTLVGPDPDATCSGPVVGTTTVPVGQSSGPFTVTEVGTYNFVATYSGDANYLPITTPVGCGDPAEMFSVALRPVGLTTQASTNAPNVPPGTEVTDVATFTPPPGAPAPTGTVTYTLVGPNPDPACAGPVVGTSTAPVGTPSEPFTVTAPGTYNFVATYSGDANYAPITTPVGCGDPNERFTVVRANPTLTTLASAGRVGGEVFDTAFLAGGFNPTGTITFELFGPNDETCAGPPIFVSVRPVTGTGDPREITSDRFILPAPGVYTWVATYSGDANNSPAGPTACMDPDETIGAGVAAVSLVTQASPSVPVGGQIFDTATLSGGFNPTGTMTFDLFGPDDDTCAGPAVFTSQVTVNGNGSYNSSSFTPTAPGNYQWVATYSGDANNASAVTACNDPLEQVLVTPLPTIQVEKTATPESRPVPGGTFTFDVVVTNTSNVALTIRTLTDDIYGDVTTIPGSTCNTAIGTVLAPSPGPGHTYSCRFPGEFRGPGGASQTDVVTVTATDERGNVVRDDDDAIVRITPVPPTITTVKTPTPDSLPEPGGTFRFNYSVTNTGPEPVTVTSIVDDVYGDLNGRGTCAIGARLAANGGTYSCSFTGNFFGNAGASQVDTITTTAVDDRGQAVLSEAKAIVRITDVPPAIRIVKTADPLSRPEPGGTFRFTLTITNPSFEPVTTTSLVDDIYGDLNGRGSCAIGVVLPANGGTYSCAFDGDFRGRAGDSQTDVVTVVGVDDEGTQVTASAQATVTITPASVPPLFRPPPPPPPVVVPPKVLVRTGSDFGGPARLGGMLVLVGMVLIAAAWRFGDGGPGLTPLPAGPGGGPSRGGGGGRRPGGDSWFGRDPVDPRQRPPGGFGGGLAGLPPPAPPVEPVGPRAEPEAELRSPEEPGRRAEKAAAVTDMPWDEWVGDRHGRVRAHPDPQVIVPETVAPEAVVPEAVAPEVVVPTVVRVRATAALDPAALDAANAGPVNGRSSAPRPSGPRPRRFGGR